MMCILDALCIHGDMYTCLRFSLISVFTGAGEGRSMLSVTKCSSYGCCPYCSECIHVYRHFS